MDPTQRAPVSRNLASQAQTAAATAGKEGAPNVSSRSGYFRWVICGLLLLGTTKNYLDRNVLGVLRVTLEHDLGWNEIDYGNLVVVLGRLCAGHAGSWLAH